MDSQSDNQIRDKNITETIKVHNLVSEANVGTWQADFMLTAVDFEHIKNGNPTIFTWANGILLASTGFGLNLIAKFLLQLSGNSQQIHQTEIVTLIVAIFIAGLLYLIGYVMPNNNNKIMTKIKNHFENAPKQRQVIRE